MIVSELINKLQELPRDKTVLVSGYESGYNETKDIKTLVLVKCDNKWWDGDYQEVNDYNPKPIDDPKEYVCLI